MMRRSVSYLAFVGALAACSKSSSSPAPSPIAEAGADAASGAPAYELAVFDSAHIGSDSNKSDFQKASGAVALHDAPFASVTLVVDLDSPCFPFDRWQSDPPPAGQSWPADCDAFDRNFEILLRDPAAPSAPALELVHAITPFGGPMHIEQDVTDVFNARRGPSMLEVGITAYADGAGKVTGSAGGWNVTAHLKVTPGAAPRNVLAVLPLFQSTVSTPDTPTSVPFALPQGTTHARIEYAATGHGAGATDAACIGPADEFCKRKHTLTIDGAPLADLTPWRDDCAKGCTMTKGTLNGKSIDYCLENPCGAQLSVTASRANWCPGSVTPASTYEPDVLKRSGEHTLAFAIAGIPNGASWLVGAKVFAYGD